MYQLREIESGQIHSVAVMDDNLTYELEITQFPFIKSEGKKIKHPSFKSASSYSKATSECVSLLVDKYKINKNYLLRQKGNIYCPFHENKATSKSPSGKFNISSNTYYCFSSHCPITTKKSINSIEFLAQLRKRN